MADDEENEFGLVDGAEHEDAPPTRSMKNWIIYYVRGDNWEPQTSWMTGKKAQERAKLMAECVPIDVSEVAVAMWPERTDIASLPTFAIRTTPKSNQGNPLTLYTFKPQSYRNYTMDDLRRKSLEQLAALKQQIEEAEAWRRGIDGVRQKLIATIKDAAKKEGYDLAEVFPELVKQQSVEEISGSTAKDTGKGDKISSAEWKRKKLNFVSGTTYVNPDKPDQRDKASGSRPKQWMLDYRIKHNELPPTVEEWENSDRWKEAREGLTNMMVDGGEEAPGVITPADADVAEDEEAKA